MHVTLAKAHRQPSARRPETCDNCHGCEISNLPIPVSVQPSTEVRLYNILMPGLGTDSFYLHPACAEYLKGDKP